MVVKGPSALLLWRPEEHHPLDPALVPLAPALLLLMLPLLLLLPLSHPGLQTHPQALNRVKNSGPSAVRPTPSRCHSHYAQQQQLALPLVDQQAQFQSMPWASLLLLLPQPLLPVRTRQQRVSLLLLLLLLPGRVLHCEVQSALLMPLVLVLPQLWVALLHQRPTQMCPPVHPGHHRQQPAL